MGIFRKRPSEKEAAALSEYTEKEYYAQREACTMKANKGLINSLESEKEAFQRLMGGTTTEHLGIIPNLFYNMEDNDLADCMKSVYANERGLGIAKESPFGKIIAEYIRKWETVFKNDDTRTVSEKQADAIHCAYTDILRAAAFRWDQNFRNSACSESAPKEEEI